MPLKKSLSTAARHTLMSKLLNSFVKPPDEYPLGFLNARLATKLQAQYTCTSTENRSIIATESQIYLLIQGSIHYRPHELQSRKTPRFDSRLVTCMRTLKSGGILTNLQNIYFSCLFISSTLRDVCDDSQVPS